MKISPTCAVLLAALILTAVGATVNTGSLQTTFAIAFFPPRVPSISQSTNVTVDLSSLSGLTPGSDIDITFTTADDLIWTGGFGADTGDLTLSCHARHTLTAGTFSTFSDETWSFGPVPWLVEMNPMDPVGYTDPVGFISGPVPQSFTLAVLWGTDLSAVNLTLTDLFSVSGVDPYITGSGVGLEYATLTTSSVPEPAIGLLTLLDLIPLLTHRRTPP